MNRPDRARQSPPTAPRSSRLGAAAAAWVATLAAVIACGPPALPNPPDARQCTTLAPVLLNLGDALRVEDGVVYARVHGCSVELLSNCTRRAHYVLTNETDALPRQLIGNYAELQATLPLDAAKLNEPLGQLSELLITSRIDSVVRLDDAPTQAGALPTCAGTSATHYVDRFLLGQLDVVGALNREPVLWGSGVVGFTLRELTRPPPPSPQRCPSGQVMVEGKCAAPVPVRGCPPGTLPGPTGCSLRPLTALRLEAMDQQAVEGYPKARVPERVRLLKKLSRLVDVADRDTVLATLYADPVIRQFCQDDRDGKSQQSLLPHTNLFAGGDKFDRAEPDTCDTVAELLEAYWQRLDAADDRDTATDVAIRLIREHPDSRYSAPAFLRAADSQCAEGNGADADRLYDYIRRKFPGSNAWLELKSRDVSASASFSCAPPASAD